MSRYFLKNFNVYLSEYLRVFRRITSYAAVCAIECVSVLGTDVFLWF